MESSKKLIIVRLIVIIVIILFIGIFVFIIVKIDIVGHLFNNSSYIRIATSSNLDSYLDDLYGREYKIQLRESTYIEEWKEVKEEVKIDKSIFKFIDNIKNKRNAVASNVENAGARAARPYDVGGNRNAVASNIVGTSDIVGASSTSPSKTDIDRETKKIQNYYDNGFYPKNAWLLIDEDLDGYGFNYYFNDKGKLIADTVSPDYRIVDIYGREVDDDLEPILYKVDSLINTVKSTKSNIENKGHISEQIIIPKGVTLKNKSKFYDNQMNRRMIDYIDIFLRFKKMTNGTIYNGTKWKSVSSLRDDGGYVIFNNPDNNFNKVIGKVTTQKIDKNDDNSTLCTLLVYDADLYEMYKGYEYMLAPLYETSAFNYSEPLDFSFTFYRTVKRLRFQIETHGDNKLRTCYLKDLRYGFNNAKYKEELEEAKENAEYITYLRELGIYRSEEEFLTELKALEEDSSSDYLEYEDFNDIDLYDNADLTDFDRNVDKEQRAIDRRTGPAFDEYLRSLKNYWEIEYGPGYE